MCWSLFSTDQWSIEFSAHIPIPTMIFLSYNLPYIQVHFY